MDMSHPQKKRKEKVLKSKKNPEKNRKRKHNIEFNIAMCAHKINRSLSLSMSFPKLAIIFDESETAINKLSTRKFY